jgi:hypothetical protein
MVEPRLKAGIRAKAILRQTTLAGGMGMMLRRGDEDSGGILLVVRDRAGGLCAFAEARATDGELAWMRTTGADPIDQAALDSYLERQLRRDPDLWVLELENKELALPFEARII